MSPLLPLEIRAAHARAERHGDWPTAARITALLATSWHREWYHRDSSRWVAAALAHEQDLDPLLVARLHIAGGLFTWVRDQPGARRHYAAGIAICRRLAPGRYLAYALALTAATFVGDESAFPAAIALSDESIALARDVGEKPLIAQALNIKAELTRIHGDDATARTVSEEGRDLAAQSGDSANLSLFLANLGSLAERRGDLVEARRLLGEALRLSWSLGRRMVTAWILGELAGPETGLGHQETAARMLGAADAALRAVGAERLPGDRPEYDRVVAALRQALGDRAFGRLHAEGTRLALDEAVELALAEPGRATVAVIPPARAGSSG